MANAVPPMGAIPPPVYYRGMNYQIPPNHHIWGHNEIHPRECKSTIHIPSRPMPLHGALHEEWSNYYQDRLAMIMAQGKTIEYAVGPDRTNGAPPGRLCRTYIQLSDVMDQPRPVPGNAVQPAINCHVADRWGLPVQVSQSVFDNLMLRYLMPIYLTLTSAKPKALKS